MKIAFDARALEIPEKTGVHWYEDRLIRALDALPGAPASTLLFSSLRRTKPLVDLSGLTNVTPRFIHLPAKISGFMTDRFNGRLWHDACLPYFIKRNGCDVFHGTDFCIPAARGFKTVVTVHDLQAFINPEFMAPEFRSWYRFWTDRSIRKADRVIVPSDYVRGCIEKYFPGYSGKVRVVYHGVDRNEYYPIEYPEIIRQFKRDHRLPDNYILYIGAVNKRKNPVALVRAFARLPETLRNSTKLLLVGHISRGDHSVLDLIEELKLQDRVIFNGYAPQKDLVYLYNGASAFIFPSLHEGFGLPVLEAMACGVPVISARTTSIPEVVGDAGILYDVNNEDELLHAMETVLNDPARAAAMRKSSLQQAALFTWKRTAAETMAVYRETMAASL